MTKVQYRAPTPDELYAFELEARRMRARAVSDAFGKGIAKIRSLLARAVSAPRTGGVRHA